MIGARALIPLALGALLASGCAGPRQTVFEPAVAPLPAQFPAGPLTHRVAPGETLWGIGQRYGVPHREIMRANGLTDPAQVPAGRVLVIPRPQAVRAAIPLYPNPRWTHIVIHHSAMDRGNARLIDRAHRRQGFVNGLGYHFVINNGTASRRDGEVEIGPRWLRQQQGAHCNAGGMNQHGIGVCLVGDFTDHPPSSAQLASLAYLVQRLRSYYGIPASRVLRHRDVPGKNTACPGDLFPWRMFLARIE